MAYKTRGEQLVFGGAAALLASPVPTPMILVMNMIVPISKLYFGTS